MKVQFSYHEKFNRLVALEVSLERMQHILAQFHKAKAAILSQQRGLVQLELSADAPDDEFGKMIYNLRIDSQEALAKALTNVREAANATEVLVEMDEFEDNYN